MIKRLLSYFTPIIEKKIPSKVSKQLELTWNSGQLVVDTKHTNYSYGNLEKVLRNGLQFIGFEKVRAMNNVLVLGLGAGNIITLLREEIKYTKDITSVELDSAILFLGKKYFDLDKYSERHTIHKMDAFEYVLRSQKRFDLIVIDIFQDANMPSFLFENYFVERLKLLLNVNGFILFNTITLNELEKRRNKDYSALFEEDIYSVRSHPKLQKYNEILTIKKLKNEK